MINQYNLYSTNIINEHFAIWKLILRIEFPSSVINRDIIIEHQFATFVDLFSHEDDNKSGGFDSIEEYNEFLTKDLDDITKDPPDHFFFGGYPISIEKQELDFFVTNNKKQKGYLIPKVYDMKTNEPLPAYYTTLVNYWYSEDKTFKGLEYPQNEDEQNIILYENQYNRLVSGYEKDGILNFNYPYILIYDDIQKIAVEYIKEKHLDIEKFNKITKELKSIEDIGVRKYLLYILNSLADDAGEKVTIKVCKNCGKVFSYVKKKIYCSEECKIQAKNKRYYQKNSIKLKNKRIQKLKGA